MAYRLNRGEVVPDGIRRIAVEELDSAAEGLRNSGVNCDEAVHEARKSIKKVRALLRLVQTEMGAAGKAENRRLRSAARRISTLRDTGALLEAVDAFEGIDPRFIEKTRGVLRAARQNTDWQSLIAHVAAVLERTAERAQSWPLEADGFQHFSPGLERTYRNGRKAMARAAKNPTDANFHEWRKEAKEHWYHVRLLAGVLGKKIEPRAQRLEHLSELLGDHQNLAALRVLIVADPRSYGQSAVVDDFLKVIDERQAELRRTALVFGRRLCRQKPRTFIRGIESLWPVVTAAAGGR